MKQVIRLKDKPMVHALYDKINITLSLPKEYETEAEAFNELSPQTYYKVEITKAVKTKTLSQNSYAWALMGEMAKVLHKWSSDIYKQLVTDFRTYTDIAITKDAVDSYKRRWERNGTGWICEVLDEQGKWVRLRCFYGMSAWSREELSEFIDLLVQECKELHIPTEMELYV